MTTQATGSSSISADTRRRRRVCSCRVGVRGRRGRRAPRAAMPWLAPSPRRRRVFWPSQAGHSFDRRPVPTCLMPAARPRRCPGQGVGARSTTEWAAGCRTSGVQFINLLAALHRAADLGYSPESLTPPASHLFVVMPPRNLSLSLIGYSEVVN